MKTTAMKETTAFLLTNAMQDTVKKGTGTQIRFTQKNMPVSGKTGTTSNNVDYWFAGYTPYYAASVWMGCDNNVSLPSISYHKPIWRDIMQSIHMNCPPEKT